MSPAYYGLKAIIAKEPILNGTVADEDCCDCCEPDPNPKRCSGCSKNANLNNAISKYQKLQKIQNTVRVSSSMYSMNLGALTVFEKPDEGNTTNWKQSSDRKEAHVQKKRTSMRSSVSVRPGNLSPGGIGVDIKHNSYARYLARLKGGRSLRKQPLPEDFDNLAITFSRGNPIYGGKVMKTSIGTNNCELNA